MTIGDRVKLLREKKGMTQGELAARLGYRSKSSVTHIERGRDIPRSMVVKLADVLDTTPAFLMGWDSPDNSNSKALSKIPYSETDSVLIPLIGKVAAGYACCTDNNITEYIRADRDIISEGYEYFWLEVKGDSMEPELREGDLVLVREQEILDSACYAVVIVDDEDGLVKFVDVKKGSKITLSSVNPYYPPRVFEKTDANRVRIVGKVIEVKRRFI